MSIYFLMIGNKIKKLQIKEKSKILFRIILIYLKILIIINIIQILKILLSNCHCNKIRKYFHNKIHHNKLKLK
jgi:hypothetical protein